MVNYVRLPVVLRLELAFADLLANPLFPSRYPKRQFANADWLSEWRTFRPWHTRPLPLSGATPNCRTS